MQIYGFVVAHARTSLQSHLDYFITDGECRVLFSVPKIIFISLLSLLRFNRILFFLRIQKVLCLFLTVQNTVCCMLCASLCCIALHRVASHGCTAPSGLPVLGTRSLGRPVRVAWRGGSQEAAVEANVIRSDDIKSDKRR